RPAAVEGREPAAREVERAGIVIDEMRSLDAGAFENFAQRQAITAAEHEHAELPPASAARDQRKRNERERLVVQLLVVAVELQIPVQVEREPPRASVEEQPAQSETLITRLETSSAMTAAIGAGPMASRYCSNVRGPGANQKSW